MGLVIDSPALAQRLGAFFDTEMPLLAYEVRLTGDGSLEWIERLRRGREVATTPSRARARGAAPCVDFLSVLPIEWLL